MVALHYLKYTRNLSDEEVGRGIGLRRHYNRLGRGLVCQQRKDEHKVYSVHEAAVECISKGKASKRCELGCKVSVPAISREGWFVGARADYGNPYNNHTLTTALTQVERVTRPAERDFLDMDYRGHDYRGEVEVHVDKRRRGRTARVSGAG